MSKTAGREACFPFWLVAGSALALTALLPEAAWAQEGLDVAYNAPQFAGGEIRQVFCDLLSLVEGEFGGLLLTAAGFLALSHAAFGDTKHATAVIPVAIGCFAAAGVVSIFFGTLCEADGSAVAGRVMPVQDNGGFGNREDDAAFRRAMGFDRQPAELPLAPAEDELTGDPFFDF